MKGNNFIAIILSFLFIFVYGFSMIGVLSNRYNISYKGFAVDSKGTVYVGFNSGRIKKFDNNKLIGSISAQTSRGYDFTIIENDVLYIDCGDRAYFTDSDGNIVEKITDNIEPFYKFRRDKSVFIANDGTEYKKKFNFGRTEIIKYENEEDKTVYQMPLGDYCVKIIIFIGSIILYGTIILIIKKCTGEMHRGNAQGTVLCVILKMLEIPLKSTV